MEIFYTSAFVRMLAKLPERQQEEAMTKIDFFRVNQNNPQLKTHKLHGALKGRFSFSINYKTRIVFSYQDSAQKIVILHAIGDHDVYEQ